MTDYSNADGQWWRRWASVRGSNLHSKSVRLSSPVLHIQSQAGQEITVGEIMEKVPDGVEDVYVKAEEGRAYLTR